jgi:hypothetical protein
VNLVYSVFVGCGSLTITALASLGLIGTILIMRADVVEGFPIGGIGGLLCGWYFFNYNLKNLVLTHSVMSVFDISCKCTDKKKGPCEVP